jgi:hypothetical protein
MAFSESSFGIEFDTVMKSYKISIKVEANYQLKN